MTYISFWYTLLIYEAFFELSRGDPKGGVLGWTDPRGIDLFPHPHPPLNFRRGAQHPPP